MGHWLPKLPPLNDILSGLQRDLNRVPIGQYAIEVFYALLREAKHEGPLWSWAEEPVVYRAKPYTPNDHLDFLMPPGEVTLRTPPPGTITIHATTPGNYRIHFTRKRGNAGRPATLKRLAIIALIHSTYRDIGYPKMAELLCTTQEQKNGLPTKTSSLKTLMVKYGVKIKAAEAK